MMSIRRPQWAASQRGARNCNTFTACVSSSPAVNMFQTQGRNLRADAQPWPVLQTSYRCQVLISEALDLSGAPAWHQGQILRGGREEELHGISYYEQCRQHLRQTREAHSATNPALSAFAHKPPTITAGARYDRFTDTTLCSHNGASSPQG